MCDFFCVRKCAHVRTVACVKAWNAIDWHFICIYTSARVLTGCWDVECTIFPKHDVFVMWRGLKVDERGHCSAVQQIKGRRVIIEKASCIFFILLLLLRPKEMHMHYCSCNGHGKYNHIIYWSVAVVDGIVVFACALTHARRKHYSNNYTIETMKWLSCL